MSEKGRKYLKLLQVIRLKFKHRYQQEIRQLGPGMQRRSNNTTENYFLKKDFKGNQLARILAKKNACYGSTIEVIFQES